MGADIALAMVLLPPALTLLRLWAGKRTDASTGPTAVPCPSAKTRHGKLLALIRMFSWCNMLAQVTCCSWCQGGERGPSFWSWPQREVSFSWGPKELILRSLPSHRHWWALSCLGGLLLAQLVGRWSLQNFFAVSWSHLISLPLAKKNTMRVSCQSTWSLSCTMPGDLAPKSFWVLLGSPSARWTKNWVWSWGIFLQQ